MPHLTVAALLALFSIASLVDVADACSPSRASAVFELDPEAWPDDVTPPGAVREVSVGASPGGESSGCDDCGVRPGSLMLYIQAPADDQAPPEALGYRITVVEGEIPRPRPDLEDPLHASTAADGSSWVRIKWDDAAGTQGLDVVLRIEAVDPAGNVGPPLELPVRTQADSGCATTPRRGDRFPLLGFGCLLFGLSRLRRRR